MGHVRIKWAIQESAKEMYNHNPKLQCPSLSAKEDVKAKV